MQARASETTVDDTPEERAKDAFLGTTIGRFTLETFVGAGGMGIVFAARDPVLDRRIALKVIQGGTSNAEVRLLREAQALAKLAHPNVVTVFEAGVGDQAGGRHVVFIAMELVDGTSLDRWLETPRTWRAIVAAFCSAGRGLAAAHAAGLVHRDFKPANVFVDRSGAVKVGDFGLVGQAGDVVGDTEASPSSSPLAVSLTKTGRAMGTPRYMAPEQSRGETVDARADQYAFCESLRQALDGVDGVPDWLESALARGLAAKRDDRWPTMAALLDVLERTPLRRRRFVIGASATVAIAGAAVIGAVVAGGGEAAVTCDGAGAERVWTEPARAAIARGFAATRLAWAGDAATRATADIDRWVARWTAVRADACRATQRGEQSAPLLDLRIACLDRALRSLDALGTALANADAKIVGAATDAIAALPAPESCTAERFANARPEIGAPQVIADVALAKAANAVELRRPDAIPLADAALAAAETIGDPAARARALAIHGRAIAGLDPVRARRELDDAQVAAAAARDPGLEAEVVFTAIRVASESDSADRTSALLPGARAAVERAGSPEPLRRQLDDAELFAAFRATRIADARALCAKFDAAKDERAAACHCRAAIAARDPKVVVARCEAAYAAARAKFGEIHPDTERALHNLVVAHADIARASSADARLAELGDLVAKLYGEQSMNMAMHLKLRSGIQAERGKHADARATLERALAIVDAIAPDAPEAGTISMDLSKRARFTKDIPAAIRYAERGLAAAERSLGKDNLEMATVWMLHAKALGADPAQRNRAIASWERALAIAERAPTSYVLAGVLAEYAYALDHWDRFAETIPVAKRAIAALEATGDKRAVGRTWMILADAHEQLKHRDELIAALRAARELLVAFPDEADSVAEIDRVLKTLR